MLTSAVCRTASSQAVLDARLGAGQHVHIATRDSATFDGYISSATDAHVTVRMHGPAGDSIISVRRADIAHAEVAVPQANSFRNALIGGVIGLAVASLAEVALDGRRYCGHAGQAGCGVQIDFGPLVRVVGTTTGLLVGWFERPKAWVPVVP